MKRTAQRTKKNLSQQLRAEEYIRLFSSACSQFSDFAAFNQALEDLVKQDKELNGAALLSITDSSRLPQFEEVLEGEIVLPIHGETEGSGYLKYVSRKDSKPFDSSDLHLMGALSDFISVLVINAQHARNDKEAAKILSYLVGQLPLGVVCFNTKGTVIVENNLAAKALGKNGLEHLRAHIEKLEQSANQRLRLHFEAGNKQLYSEGRILKVDSNTEVAAFVIYDFSPSREKLQLTLERDILTAESESKRLITALIRDNQETGRIQRLLKDEQIIPKLEKSNISVFDAHSCLCVFEETSPREVRAALRKLLEFDRDERIHLAIADSRERPKQPGFAQVIIHQLESQLAKPGVTLKPQIEVVAAPDNVYESIEMLIANTYSLSYSHNPSESYRRVLSGEVDVLIIDTDTKDGQQLPPANIEQYQASIVWISYRQPAALKRDLNLPHECHALQKPFTNKIVETTLKKMLNRY